MLTLGLLWGSLSGGFGDGVREAVYPFENLALHLREWVRKPFGVLVASRIEEENRFLERENLALRHRLIRLGALERENRRLRALLHMAEKRPGRVVTVRVISRGGAGGWWNRVRVAGGTKDGITPGLAVCGPNGLLGKIVSAGASTAEVLLVTDPNSRVACAFDPPIPGGRGIVFGGGVRGGDASAPRMLYTVEPLAMRYFDRDATVPEGRRVVTSGLGGLYPPHIPVGRVIDTAIDPNGLYGEARVAPFEFSADLTHVLVLMEGEWP